MRRVTIMWLALAVLALPIPALAQHNAYLLPVEKAHLETGLEVQLFYSHRDTPGYWNYTRQESVSGSSLHLLLVSLAGSLAIADRLEVGFNIPFIHMASRDVGTTATTSTEDEVHFGDISVNLKLRLVSHGALAVSLFVNTRLPSHSWEGTRDYAVVHFGGVVSANPGRLRAGGGMSFLLYALEGDDTILLGMDGYIGYKVLDFLVLQTAVQCHASPDIALVAFIPGVELEFGRFRLGLATRIGVTRETYNYYNGWASLLFHGGMVF